MSKTSSKKIDSDPFIPSEKDIQLAIDSSRSLAQIPIPKTGSFNIQVEGTKEKQTIRIPASVLKMLFTILTQMAAGNAVTIRPIHTELTTQEAADFLNVSRPYLISLLEAKKIPCRKVGTRRKILFLDILEYKKKDDLERKKVLDKLTQEAQDLDMGY